MFAKTCVIAACFAVFGAASASAATVSTQYGATSAVGNGATHSLWLKGGDTAGIGRNFSFDPMDPGLLTLFDDGTGTLTGTAHSHSVANSGFFVDFNYDSDFSDNADPTPEFKSQLGSQPTGDLLLMDVAGGTLTGFGSLLGLNISISRAPVDGKYAFQIGSSNGVNPGPNNKNTEFGGAHWFLASVTSATCGMFCDDASALNGQGDINVNLSVMPLPASAFFLAGGLGVLGGLRRRKKKAA